ncbi:hypothetical protein PMZ80_000559 [Knufia obscura]|uniref:Uncharacterized protein n=2 Tax=Knufia TaxID=430999 RepID=A0AAN8EIL6_9EURO|nr:hypothetical protein PMZ80_000559 [Knufia obscura]KAK5956514.1 hypothetical protein OHC33_001999 [Knufia fluminis]
MFHAKFYLLALAALPALHLVSADETKIRYVGLSLLWDCKPNGLLDCGKQKWIAYCSSLIGTCLIVNGYEDKTCVPLLDPEKYGDKGSVFINQVDNLRCHMYVDVDCNEKVNEPLSDHIDKATGTTYTWNRDELAHAFRCGKI